MIPTFPRLYISLASKPSDLGVKLYNAAFEATGIDATYIAIGTTETERAVAAARTLGFAGISLGVPHKERAVALCDNIDDEAKQIGSVNTLVDRDGVLYGYNLDGYGFVTALREKTDIADRHVLLLGAGGSARAIVFSLLREGARVTLLNRTLAAAERIQRSFPEIQIDTLENIRKHDYYDILVNATSVGFFDANSSPIPSEALLENKIVFDIVFFPKETKLLRDARSRKCEIGYGLDMLLHVSARRFTLLTGYPAPLDIMRSALNDAAVKSSANR